MPKHNEGMEELNMTPLTIKKGSKMTSIINTVDAVGIIEKTAQEAQNEAEQENAQIAPVEADSAPPSEVCGEDNALAPFVGTALDGIETDIDLELATRAHNGTSFSPEQRGRGEVANWIEFIKADYELVMKHAKDDSERRTLDAAFYDYRVALRSKKRTLLSAHSGIVSTMIAGPSNFPARQMNKRNASYDNKVNEYLEFRTKALARMCKTFAEPVGIRTGESGAADALQAKIDKAEELQTIMKAANTAMRKYAKKGPDAQAVAMVEAGLTETQARGLLSPGRFGGPGFASFELTNNNANIRRMKEQLAKAKSLASMETKEIMIGDVKIIDNLEDDRLQMFFPVERVARPIYDLLKSHGFRWTPSVGCFQAYRGNSANYWYQIIAKEFNKQKEAA